MKTFVLAFAVFVGLCGLTAASPFPGPYHAFCRTLWLFSTPCDEVTTRIAQQIQAFNPVFGCDKCHYKLMSATPVSIVASHTSLNGLQAENITLNFESSGNDAGCRVVAMSTSLGFTSLLDDGINYCNLYNLLSASGLEKVPGFREMTNEWACLGYGLATCKA